VKQFGFDKQRGIIHSWANTDGTQKIEDLGGFGQERQRTLDQDILKESKRFIKDAAAAGKPFFVWHNTTRMHYKTNLSTTYAGKSGYGLYADGMMEMDDIVGGILKQLEESGVANNTIVMFATDNGAASNSWPDGGNQPFHGEKGAGGWEGGFRVPCVVSWPGHITAGKTTGEFMTMEDWLPTLLSFAGQPNVKEELLAGKTVGNMTYKVHLDGYDQSDLILNQGKSKRKDFYYFTETTFHGFRYGDWKFLYKKQEKWFNATQEELTTPFIINLKLDPFERFVEAGGRGYDEWEENHAWLFGPAMMQVAEYVKSYKDFPPRQPSFSPKVDDLIKIIGKQGGKD
jgi:arylsulfatase